MGLLDYHNFLNEGKKSKASGLGYDAIPDEYKLAAEKGGKKDSFEKFWGNLPEGEGKNELFDYLNQNSNNSSKVKVY